MMPKDAFKCGYCGKTIDIEVPWNYKKAGWERMQPNKYACHECISRWQDEAVEGKAPAQKKKNK